MGMTQALADVSTHDAKMAAFTMNTKEIAWKARQCKESPIAAMSAMSAVHNVTAGCRWVINETFAKQGNACMSGRRIAYLPSAAYPDVKHV